jgi:hypothetical protein
MSRLVKVVFLAVAVLLLSASPKELVRPKVPNEIAVPPGHQLLAKLEARGIQIYKAVEAKPGQLKWGLEDPLADLNGTTLTQIDFPGATLTQAFGVNYVGQVVGAYVDVQGAMHGFVDTNGSFQSVDNPRGVGTTTVNGTNDKGQLVGFYVNGVGNTIGFVASPAPEPSSLALAGFGILSIGLRWTLKRRNR